MEKNTIMWQLVRKLKRCIWRVKTLDNGCKKYRFLFIRWKRKAPEESPHTLHKVTLEEVGQQLAECKQQLQHCKALLAKHQEKWEDYEKGVIALSPYWDPLWYVQKYGHNFNRYEALDYWYKTGFRNGECPSEDMIYSHRNGEPSALASMKVHLRKSIFFTRVGNCAPMYNDAARIEQYVKYRETRKAKGVVYSCITNGYDDIEKKLIYRYIDFDWDYVLYTDDEKLVEKEKVGIWLVRPLQFTALDDTRNSRWHKTHPHILFPDYEESLFIDGSVNITSDYLFRIIRDKGTPILLPRHFKNLCIYQEFNDVLAAKLDDPELIKAERRLIEEDGMPAFYGIGETGILYRNHANPVIAQICDEWWNMIETYSKRDQLSFSYILWKHGIKVSDVTFENARMLKEHFFFFDHAKPRQHHA